MKAIPEMTPAELEQYEHKLLAEIQQLEISVGLNSLNRDLLMLRTRELNERKHILTEVQELRRTRSLVKVNN